MTALPDLQRELFEATKNVAKPSPYREYTPTGAEWLPEAPAHWVTKRLKYAFSEPSKAEVRHFSDDTEVSFVPMEAVGEYGGMDLESTRPISEVLSGYTYFRDGDVVVAKITPCFENGKGALARRLTNGIAFGTTELHVIRPGREVFPPFLLYLTLSQDFRQLGAAEMYGAGGQKRVPDRFLRELRHPLPPIDEQRQIAAFMDRETAKIDELVAKKRRLIELLKEKRTALISHAVTKGLDPNAEMKDSGVEWLGKVPNAWNVLALRRVASVDQGSAFAHSIQGQTDGDIPWFKVADMNRNGNEEFLRTAENYVSNDVAAAAGATVFPPGSTAFPRVGAALLTNKRRLLVERSIVDDNVYVVIPNRGVSPNYLYLVMSCIDMASLCSAGLVPTVTFSAIRELRLPQPSLSEQREIAARIDEEAKVSQSLVGRINDAIRTLSEYRSALISAAVTGKIDVREA